MIVIPAIDLMDGKAVRLARGEREAVTVYDDEPTRVVDRFASAGARRIHVVDLDGAFAGRPTQRDAIAGLAARARTRGVTVQTGGGIRDAATVEALFDAGIDQVVIGTLAVREPAVAASLCRRHPGRIVVAVDAREGMVTIAGWRETSGEPVAAVARRAESFGAAALLYTDVSRDGMRTGPAVAETAALQAQVSISVWASGGVGRLEHIEACARAGLHGVIVGRALYEREFTLEEALARC